jgi:hypothetical protein
MCSLIVKPFPAGLADLLKVYMDVVSNAVVAAAFSMDSTEVD